MSDGITRDEYWNEIRSIAQEMAEEFAGGEHGTGEQAREAFSERLHETIDGHQWVIYTYQSQCIVPHSDSDGYSAENFGAESVVGPDGVNWAALAFGCLYGDVETQFHRGVTLQNGKEFDANDPCPEKEAD